MSTASEKHAKQHATARRTARLRAIQALFQMDIGGMGARRVIEEFKENRLGGVDDTGTQSEADIALFEKLVRGVVEFQTGIDKAISQHLAKNWRLERLDTTVRAILRVASFEIMHSPKTPVKVILDEYIDLAGDFFSGPEPGFVNGALEALARNARQDELS
ncbi:MAG: transcription antitermination factor NusB [Robiginitomaculum sp.]|nr:MAG: transcription antitermination factor NusB [Robiginitomaculum sp.]